MGESIRIIPEFRILKLTTVDPQEKSTWRSGVRSAMCALQLASYLEGGPLLWMMPLYLHINQKSDYDMI